MRLAVYLDYRFWRCEGRIWTERAFIVFLGGLAEQMGGLVMAGRLDPSESRSALSHYPLPDGIRFAPLPWYSELADPRAVARALGGSARRFWRILDEVDAVWLFGPHPMCLVFAAVALIRRRRVFLGIRQDLPVLLRAKHPHRRMIHLVADGLERSYRVLSRFLPTVVVGPDLAENYRHARRLLPISVSLIREADIPEDPPTPDWPSGTPPVALSVGRLEAEKNPLLLADVLERTRHGRTPWRLRVCGEGPLEEGLRERLALLGVDDSAELLGYVPVQGGLFDLYRTSDALLHVSWTEGVPQILFEAFAAGLPVVATDVGGVAQAAGDAALLVPAGDPDAAAAALEHVASDAGLRTRLIAAGFHRVRDSTLEAECRRLAAFLRAN